MPIVLNQQRMIFLNVPKVASTSVKQALYRIETGEEFRHEGPGRHIHAVMRDGGDPRAAISEHPGFWTFTIVRDPVHRLLSAYANRVREWKDHLRRNNRPRWHLRLRYWRRGLPAEPDVDKFFDHVDRYRALSYSIRHHTEPMSTFIGPDLGRIDAIYRIEDLARLEAELVARTGIAVTLPREKTAGTKIRFGDVARRTQKKLLDMTREEYRYLGGLYDPPSIGTVR